MRLIPVIDVRGGIAVHAVAGERASYQPLRSALTASTAPAQVAADLHEHLRNRELYVADLDAIEAASMRDPPPGTTAALSPAVAALLRWAAEAGVSVLLDAGIASPGAARALLRAAPGARVVVGTETLAVPAALGEIVAAVRAPAGGAAPLLPAVVASLDLRAGRLLSPAAGFAGLSAAEAARRLAGEGVAEMIVLDLARVGTGQGAATDHLAAILDACPDVAILVGGGVRELQDVQTLASSGVRGALIATALHGGAISPADWRRYAEQAV